MGDTDKKRAAADKRLYAEGRDDTGRQAGGKKEDHGYEIYEQCVCCGKRVGIPTDMEIEFRPFYIEGAGQLCYDCYHTIYRSCHQ